MNLIKPTSPVSNLSDVQYKFFVSEEYEKHEKEYENIRKLSFDKSIYMIDEDTYAYETPFCSECYSRNVSTYGYNSKMLIDEYGIQHDIFVQRYYCKKCGKYTQTEFTEQYSPYCNFSNTTKNKSVETMELDRVSLRNASKIHKIYNNVNLSHETVRKSCLILNETYFTCDIEELSGYCGYDEQWSVNDGVKWIYRYVLFDLVNNMPIAEALYDDLKSSTIEEFIEKSIPLHKRKVIVTDLKDEYDSLMTKLGFEHQYCTFHLSKNINKKIKEHLNKIEKKLERKIKKNHPELNKKQLKEKVQKELKLEKEEIKLYKGVFLDLFKRKTYEDALEYVEGLKKVLDDFPDFLAKYLKREFFPKYKKFLTYLKKPHLGKIGSTNNKTENYIGNIMPKSDKNKYRTKIGFINQIYHRTNNWGNNTNFN